MNKKQFDEFVNTQGEGLVKDFVSTHQSFISTLSTFDDFYVQYNNWLGGDKSKADKFMNLSPGRKIRVSV